MIYYESWGYIYLLKTLNGSAKESIIRAIESGNRDSMGRYIQFAEEYPDNKDLRIIQNGEIHEINIEY